MTHSQMPPIEPGVSLELAKWRAERYSDVRYKLNLTLEKMSPVLKGTIEIRVKVSEPGAIATGSPPPIILDWRKIAGHEEKSSIANISLNGVELSVSPLLTRGLSQSAAQLEDKDAEARASARAISDRSFEEYNEHLIFRDGVVLGENVIKLDFTSPILTSGSAITRYVDKEDGSEYIYSLFVPSDASTAFPVFDQPDLKARFELKVKRPKDWEVISNALGEDSETIFSDGKPREFSSTLVETKPISTYVFAFAAGPWERVSEPPAVAGGLTRSTTNAARTSATDPNLQPPATAGGSDRTGPQTSIYVRKSQAAKFKPHAAEVFRLNREAIKYFEEYFDYKFPFPKYDLVLIPEFPFGGMEHAGATFLRESSIIFPQEPTRNDHISRALLIFHEASHQWFGDTVTMRWFDDLWLKEGFATFTAYKAMERIMPETMAWKVFYERVKQAAYQTDSTKGTTPIYQEIPNLSAAKSAYGNIVYNKAPAFLRQAEFYLGEDKFQTAVRAFLKKHEFGNAGWEDLVKQFELASKQDLKEWADVWVSRKGLPAYRVGWGEDMGARYEHKMEQINAHEGVTWKQRLNLLVLKNEKTSIINVYFEKVYENRSIARMEIAPYRPLFEYPYPELIFPNHGDLGYGIFLLDRKSRDYVLKNIQNEKDPFLRSMMWGALWDSVREGELDPREFVELVVRVQSSNFSVQSSNFSLFPGGKETSAGSGGQAKACTLNCDDESTTALLLSRVGTAMNYYIDDSRSAGLRPRVEDLLIEQMQSAETLGQRITYYRAFLNIASSANGREVLRAMLKTKIGEKANDEPKPFPPGIYSKEDVERILRFEEMLRKLPLKTKDKFDIVTRLLILGDPDAATLLAELEKTESSDDAKRYAYAARAGIATAENKAKYWNDFVSNKDISESWIEAAFGPWNSIRHSELTLPYLQRALAELPNHKRNRKIFFVNGWLGAFIGGQRSEEALGIINKFLADNPTLDRDLRLKILENADIIERAVKIRGKYSKPRS
ncbi:MAG: hypothetical protein IPM50_09910 [Acidobacteriota bacterium]|nr:MAG: hypothetical protein IPM50_09910 [Acidobacteriota bacterium]